MLALSSRPALALKVPRVSCICRCAVFYSSCSPSYSTSQTTCHSLSSLSPLHIAQQQAGRQRTTLRSSAPSLPGRRALHVVSFLGTRRDESNIADDLKRGGRKTAVCFVCWWRSTSANAQLKCDTLAFHPSNSDYVFCTTTQPHNAQVRGRQAAEKTKDNLKRSGRQINKGA